MCAAVVQTIAIRLYGANQIAMQCGAQCTLCPGQSRRTNTQRDIGTYRVLPGAFCNSFQLVPSFWRLLKYHEGCRGAIYYPNMVALQVE